MKFPAATLVSTELLILPPWHRSQVFSARLHQRACLLYSTQMQKITFNCPAKHSSAAGSCHFCSAPTCKIETILCAPSRLMKTWKHHHPLQSNRKPLKLPFLQNPNKRNRTNTMYSKSAKENLKSQHAQQRNAKAFVKAETHHENYQQIPDKTNSAAKWTTSAQHCNEGKLRSRPKKHKTWAAWMWIPGRMT